MRIAVYGGAGLVGRALSRTLETQGHTVFRFDVQSGLDLHFADLLHTDLQAQLSSHAIEAVTHLVARVDPPTKRGREAMRVLHEVGTERLVLAAIGAGVKRLVLCSSAVVYGARANNPIPLTENDPVQPNANFPYAVDKAAQERICLQAADSLSVAIARPPIIYSAEAKNYLTEFLRRVPLVLPAVDGQTPPLQFIHVDDVAAALSALLLSTVTGPFNLGPPPLSYREVAALVHKRVVPIPRRLIARLATMGAEFVPASLRAPDYVLDQLAYPYVVSSQRIRDVLGVEAQVTGAQALREMMRSR